MDKKEVMQKSKLHPVKKMKESGMDKNEYLVFYVLNELMEKKALRHF